MLIGGGKWLQRGSGWGRGGEWLVSLSQAGLGPLPLVPIKWELLKDSREQRSVQPGNLGL